jgi:hypothetical protein
MEESNTNQSEWRLQKIEIEYNSWGDNKGKYTGRICFQNKDVENFTFNIRPDMAQQYIELISSEVVKSAESLGSKLVESLGLKK